jgi:hypothetical protein
MKIRERERELRQDLTNDNPLACCISFLDLCDCGASEFSVKKRKKKKKKAIYIYIYIYIYISFVLSLSPALHK